MLCFASSLKSLYNERMKEQLDVDYGMGLCCYKVQIT